MAALRSGRQVRIIGGRTVNMWRPFHSLIKFWTPPNSDAGVQSTLLSSFVRLTHSHMASIPHSFSNLDAIRTITRRPILLTFSNWTPLNSGDGVRSAQLIQSGRLVSQHLASISITSKILDASRTHQWRPFRTASPIWTPRQSTCGVQSTLSSPFGRNATFGRHATFRRHATIRIQPPTSPEFRKIKQATAWLSIILESGQLPSSL